MPLTEIVGLSKGCRLTFLSTQTRFESVHPGLHKSGLGRLLYDCAASWTHSLVLNDELVKEGVIQSRGDYCLVSMIDAPESDGDNQDEPVFKESGDDNEHGHGTFLKKLGFVRAQHDFGQDDDKEITFQRGFHVPLLKLF